METVSPHWSSTKLLSPLTMMLDGNCLTTLVTYKSTVSTNHDVGWKLSHHIGYLQSYCHHQPWCLLETVSPHWSSTKLLSPPTKMLAGNCLTTLVIYKATVSSNHDVGWKLSHHMGSSTKLLSPPTMMLDGNCLTTLVIYKATVSSNRDVKHYICRTDTTFKARYINHTFNFNHEDNKNSLSSPNTYGNSKIPTHSVPSLTERHRALIKALQLVHRSEIPHHLIRQSNHSKQVSNSSLSAGTSSSIVTFINT